MSPDLTEADSEADPSRAPLWQRTALILTCAGGAPIGALMFAFAGRNPNPWAWVGLVIIGVSFGGTLILRLPRFRSDLECRPAARRYRRRLMAIMGAYLVFLFAGVWMFHRGLTAGWLGYPIAIAPAVPIIGVFWLLHRYLQEETDEVMRHVLLTSLMWSGALTLSEATVWGFLETFGKAPHVWLWAVPVAFFAQMGLTQPLVLRRLG